MKRTKIRFWKGCLLLTLVFTVLLVGKPSDGYAQTEPTIESQPPEYNFGENILFQATLHSDVPVEEVLLLVQNGPGAEVRIIPTELNQEGSIKADYSIQKNPLRAFSEVDYWFQTTLQNGETYTSPTTSFLYSDNRFDWDMIESAPLRVHWHTGDIAFAQEILNTAQAGVQRAQQILPQVLVPPVVDIYVYLNGEELQETLVASNQKWIAGHADPDLSVILVTLPPGPEQRLEMERQIPHELMHVMMYYTDAHAYANLPVWFNEGLASLVELYPNPDYQALLQNAFQTNSLMPLEILCKVFPTDPHRALLAYAESASFMNFLFEKYDSAGFERLMALYAQGQSCEQAIAAGFSATLTSLENQWQRENFGRYSSQRAVEEMLPWLVLIFFVLAGPLILMINMFRHRTAKVDL